MKAKKHLILGLFLSSVFNLQVAAQIAISSFNIASAQDFNSYAGSLATVPSGWTVSFSGSPNFNDIGTGSSQTGGAWAYGTGGDFSFGALRSGTPGNITLSANFINNTGMAITDLSISWDYEQWRYSNTSGLSISGTGGLSGNATLDAQSFIGTATGSNGTASSTNVSITLTSLSIPNGSSFGIQWLTTDLPNSDNGVAIDNFSLTAIPEPSTYAIMTSLAALAIAMCFRRRSRRLRIASGT